MAKRNPTVNFSARQFRTKHGFLPRGVALWMFYFSDAPDTPWCGADTPLTYFDAKQLATLEARKRGVSAVRVDPDPKGLKLYDTN